jgi:SAM-dependent methyltransferase
MQALLHPLMPPKLKRIARDFGTDCAVRILDIGCGNGSASRTKRWFPECEYHGLDRGNYNNSDADFSLMTAFYEIDLEEDSAALDRVPTAAFDVVIVAHVIEHLRNGLDVIQRLVPKLRPGGRIYIEWPGARSLGLPSMRGTLHFCDDATHVRVYSVREVANTLLDSGCRIISAGTRRDLVRTFATPINFTYQFLRDGQPSAASLWDIMGFAEFAYASRMDARTYTNEPSPAADGLPVEEAARVKR